MKYKFLSLLALGAVSAASAQVLQVSTDITSDTTWGANETDVVLTGPIFVKNDATLTILPGTIVRGQPKITDPNDSAETLPPGSLIVTQSGRVVADGSVNNPIIFTTAAIDNNNDGIPDGDGSNLLAWTPGATFHDADPLNNPLPSLAPGAIDGSQSTNTAANTELWGGLVILGNAPTNLGGANAPAGFGYIEGLPNTADTIYGGALANDDSGVYRYVSVRHGGERLGTANEINGITMGGVGYGTVMEFCEVYCTFDDGFEWFGGTNNGNNLAVFFAGDDSYDGDQGWTGQVQFALAVLHYDGMGDSGGNEAFEFDGDDAPDTNEDLVGNPAPLANYTFANFTVVGPTGTTGYDVNTPNVDPKCGRIRLRNNYSGQLYNGYVVNPRAEAFNIPTVNPVVLDSITLKNGTTVGFDHVNPPANVTVRNFVTNGSGLIGEDAGVANGLNPRPISSGFPAPAGVTSSLQLGAQFETVSYRGAFSPLTAQPLWTTGWTSLNKAGILVD